MLCWHEVSLNFATRKRRQNSAHWKLFFASFQRPNCLKMDNSNVGHFHAILRRTQNLKRIANVRSRRFGPDTAPSPASWWPRSQAVLSKNMQKLSKLAKLHVACFFQNFKFCNFLAGSFSAVSKRKFSRKYAFDSIFQALQDLHTFAPLQSQNISKN